MAVDADSNLTIRIWSNTVALTSSEDVYWGTLFGVSVAFIFRRPLYFPIYGTYRPSGGPDTGCSILDAGCLNPTLIFIQHPASGIQHHLGEAE